MAMPRRQPKVSTSRGVEPGTKWWEGGQGPKTVQLPVALADVKTKLQPLYARLMREAEIAPPQGSKASALYALDRLMKAPDHAPLSEVDAALGEIKGLARAKDGQLRSIGQGIAAQSVKALEEAVQQTAHAAGPEVVQALHEGRQATIAKVEAATILDRLEGATGEGVGSFRRLTRPADAEIGHLRDVLQQAPSVKPDIARAVIDGVFQKATEHGGWDHPGTIANKWRAIGPGTKSLLYDQAYIKAVDHFVLLSEKMAASSNPSRSALTATSIGSVAALWTHPVAAVTSMVGAAGLSKLFHSAAGVRLLTDGYRLPLRNPVVAAAYAAKVKAAVGPALQPVMAGDTPPDSTPATATR